jgi:hypothetical protein
MHSSFNEIIAQKTDTELLAAIKEPQQFQPEYMLAVEKELETRGIPFIELKQRVMQYLNIAEAIDSDGRPGDSILIGAGFVFAFLGGILGVIIGANFYFSTKRGVSGYAYPVYDKKTRQLGGAMMLISIIIMIFSMVYKMTS